MKGRKNWRLKVLWLAALIITITGIALVIGHKDRFVCSETFGYICSNVIYNPSTGTLELSLGQHTGVDWATANIVFVPAGSRFGYAPPDSNQIISAIPDVPFSAPYAFISNNGFKNGSTMDVIMRVGNNESSVLHSGTVWGEFTLGNGDPGVYFIQVAAINYT